MDIVLYNCCGCEIARESVKTLETPAEALSRCIYDEQWKPDFGDCIKFEDCWHED